AVVLSLAVLAAACLLPARAEQTGSGDKKDVAIQPGSGKTWALLIGVKDYQSVPKLQYTAADADSLADTLTKVGGVAEDHILRIPDEQPLKPDHDTLTKKVGEWLARPEIGPEDVVLVFFSGHGVLGPEEVMYLAPRDIKLNAIKESGVPAAGLREQLRK